MKQDITANNLEEEIADLKRKFKLKELELNALLEITKAINNNVSEDDLYKIYKFSIRANLKIEKLVLFVFDGIWLSKVQFGVEGDLKGTKLSSDLLSIHENSSIDSLNVPPIFEQFDEVIPISHKKELLALVFVGQNNSDEEGLNVTFLHAISNLIIVAIENKKLARKELRQEAFRKELEIAKEVQNFLFPDELPYGIRLKIQATYLPHHTIGGDYYDYIPINQNQFLICIADVSGKGVPAAILMSNFQASLRTLTRQTTNLSIIIEELNYQILDSAKGENFITFFAAIYDHNLKEMVYVNSGHNPPVLVEKNKEIKHLEAGSTILGMFHPLPFINEGYITDLDDFLLVCYTDGITETFNEQDEEYGEKRLYDFISRYSNEDLNDLHRKLFLDIEEFKGKRNYQDDLTFLSCRVQP
jgi:sigma-B regulation protein RsbU (phosphoserine phosphatase)